AGSITVNTSISLPTKSVELAALADGMLQNTVVASSITVGSVYPAAVSAGSYPNITGVGTLTAGSWNASTVGSQYGGTGANLSGGLQGAVPFFSANGVLGA